MAGLIVHENLGRKSSASERTDATWGAEERTMRSLLKATFGVGILWNYGSG
jgi:hypothetical protein